jgi:hypothetical protein
MGLCVIFLTQQLYLVVNSFSTLEKKVKVRNSEMSGEQCYGGVYWVGEGWWGSVYLLTGSV